jgi:hypothetical protein
MTGGRGAPLVLLAALAGAIAGFGAGSGLTGPPRLLLALLVAEAFAGVVLLSTWGRGRLGIHRWLTGAEGQGPCATASGAFLHSAPLFVFALLADAPSAGAGLTIACALGALALARLPAALQRPGVLLLWFLLAVAAKAPLGTLAPFYAPLLFAKVLLGALPEEARAS